MTLAELLARKRDLLALYRDPPADVDPAALVLELDDVTRRIEAAKAVLRVKTKPRRVWTGTRDWRAAAAGERT